MFKAGNRKALLIRTGAILIGLIGLIASLLELYDRFYGPGEEDLVQKGIAKYEELKRQTDVNAIGTGGDIFKQDFEAAIKTLQAQGEEGRKAVEEFIKSGKTEDARALLQKLAESREKAQTAAAQGAAEAYRQLGAVAELNDAREAERYYRKSVELDPKNIEGWFGLGMQQRFLQLYKKPGSLEAAEESFNKILTLSRQKQDRHWEITALVNLSNIHKDNGDWEKAEQNITLAQSVAKQLPSDDKKLRFISIMIAEADADLLLGQKKFAEAEQKLEDLLIKAQNLDWKEAIISCTLRLIEAYENDNKPEKLKFHAERLFELAKKSNNLSQLLTSGLHLADQNEKAGDNKGAAEIYNFLISLDTYKDIPHNHITGFSAVYGKFGLLLATKQNNLPLGCKYLKKSQEIALQGDLDLNRRLAETTPKVMQALKCPEA